MTDHLGNVRAVVNLVLEQNDYRPFGERIDDERMEADGENRYRFAGKEEQTFLNGVYSDFGARFYSSDIQRWTTPDPLAEKYYDLSPYAFCNNNPINFVDPDGMDIWEIDKSGVVRWIEESDEHRLYSVDSLGNRSVDYVEVKDRNILDALTDKKGVASYTSSTNIDDFFKVFLFASDNSNVEWALHRGQDNSYTIGTSHKEGEVAAYSVLSKVDELPIASLHSHPDVVTHKKERESMGYDEGWVQYANDRQKVYWGVVPKYNYVYFPISKTLYNVESDNPRYVKHINTFKDFYFGTLNYR